MKALLRRRWFQVIVVIALVFASASYLIARDVKGNEGALIAKVKKGDFKVTVTSSGELRAPKFVQITLPQNSQQAESFQLKIQSLVPEGTVVKEGDVVAEIDRTTVAQKLADFQLALEEKQVKKDDAQQLLEQLKRQARFPRIAVLVEVGVQNAEAAHHALLPPSFGRFAPG